MEDLKLVEGEMQWKNFIILQLTFNSSTQKT